MCWSANISLIFTRCLICGSSTIYIHTQQFLGADISTCPFDVWYRYMLLGTRVHAMLLYIVIYLSVLIPLSAYVGQRTFHIYMHSVFDISIRWSVNVYLIYIITWCLPYVGQQPSTYMLGISSAWIFWLAHLTHEHFTNAFNIYIHLVFDMFAGECLHTLMIY